MSATWTISVGSRVYGPYSAEQMRAFQGEGRLASHSLVARAGDEQFRPAGEDDELAYLFDPQAARPVRPEPQAEPQPITATQAEPHRFGRGEPEAATGERTRYVILADMKSGSISALEDEIFKLGEAYGFMPQAWVLSSEASLNAVRHALLKKLGKLDVIFIVDAVHDRAAWFNFGMEPESRLRRMWSRSTDSARKAG